MFQYMLENVRKRQPLIHNITNYVTAHECANILIACGASPIMADDKEEVAEITGMCAGLNINIGTPNSRTLKSMLIAGKQSNKLQHPVVLDPVGVGVSKLRRKIAFTLLDEVKFSAIRGNISEIKALIHGNTTLNGVDANITDKVTKENLDEAIEFAKSFSKATGAIIVITGAVDIVANHSEAYCIHNGHPMMSSVTGTGCQLSAITAAFLSANPDNPLKAAAAAVATMGYAGEIAYSRLGNKDGNATYSNYIIDAVYNMTPDLLERGAKYEMR